MAQPAKCSPSVQHNEDVPSLLCAGGFQDLSKVHLLCLLPASALSLIRIILPYVVILPC